MQNAEEFCHKLKEVIGKKDRMIQSKVMILKFREEALKKYEKASKEKREMEDTEKNDVIVSSL